MNVLDFYNMKQKRQKITMLTCYDYTSARLLSQTAVDCILVGDSVAMTMHGFKDTLQANIEMMCFHIAAVKRGAENKFIVGDMPFLSYRKSLSKNMTAAEKLMQAGSHAVKLEGLKGNQELIRHLTDSGIPVMGHIGLTPQFVNILGGYKVQGKTADSAKRLKEEALLLQEAGCFAIVLECVPTELAKDITEILAIPTIGIGAGPYTDGQVQVWQDLLGLNIDFKPKFVKNYLQGADAVITAIESYITETKFSEFPQHAHSYE